MLSVSLCKLLGWIAFQIADDLFAYTLETTDLGKEIGADLKEGEMSLPVIHALKQANSTDRGLMVKVIKDKNFSLAEFKTLVGMLQKYGGIAYTEKMAAFYIKKAKDALSVFNSSETKVATSCPSKL